MPAFALAQCDLHARLALIIASLIYSPASLLLSYADFSLDPSCCGCVDVGPLGHRGFAFMIMEWHVDRGKRHLARKGIAQARDGVAGPGVRVVSEVMEQQRAWHGS